MAQGPTELLVGVGQQGKVIVLGDERSSGLREQIQKRKGGLNVVCFGVGVVMNSNGRIWHGYQS